MIAAPEGANDTHLQALAALSRLLIDPDFVAKLKTATTADQVQQLSPEAEAKADALAEEAANQKAPASERPYIVAVTACPTGSPIPTWQKML